MKKKKFISRNIVLDNTKIIKVMNIFDKTGIPIVFIINKKKQILGSISDGDIRRAILKKININEKASLIMNRSPKYIDYKQENDIKKIKWMMKKNSIRFIPVIRNKTIINIIDRESILENKIFNTDVIIMAGGKGKRLLPITKKIPKPLVKIGQKTILEKIIENFKNEGFNNFTIIVNHFGDLIIDQFTNLKDSNIKISFIKEKKALGTIGGLSLIKKKITNNFILVNADVLTNLNISKMIQYHKDNKSLATVGCINQKQQLQYGIINYRNNKFINMVEKPIIKQFVNAGIYIFNKKIIKYLKKNKKIDAPEFLNSLSGKVKIFPIYEDWIDVGTHNNLIKASKFNG